MSKAKKVTELLPVGARVRVRGTETTGTVLGHGHDRTQVKWDDEAHPWWMHPDILELVEEKR